MLAAMSNKHSHRVDYERLEAAWRAGRLSVRELAEKYQRETGQAVSHAAIVKHFKRRGIARDLGGKIAERARTMAAQAVAAGQGERHSPLTETRIVEENARQVMVVALEHRSDIRRRRDLGAALFDELAACEKSPDTLPERTRTFKALVESLRVLIDMERRALGMDEAQTAEDGMSRFLKSVANQAASGFAVLADDMDFSPHSKESCNEQ